MTTFKITFVNTNTDAQDGFFFEVSDVNIADAWRKATDAAVVRLSALSDEWKLDRITIW